MATDLSALTQSRVLRLSDVAAARERARRARLRLVAAVLAPLAVLLIVRDLLGNPVQFGLPHLPSGLARLLPAFGLIVLLAAVTLGPLAGAGRSPHILYRPEELDTGLADVVGAGAVVEEVVKTLNLFLAFRTFKERMGGTPRRAVLFEGPPGTGKTYLAKAMAREAGVPFLFVSSSAFQSMFYGQTNRKIRSYFKALRAAARREGGAIGFIEEIDAIGASRSGMGGSTQREGVAGVVNELLIQLQSFDRPPGSVRLAGWLVDGVNHFLPAAHRLRKPTAEPANILVVGATNRAADLDPALLRPGRFDRCIYFDLPSKSGRREILDYYLERKSHDATLDEASWRDALAAMTLGYSPVMLERLLDESLIWALRRGADRLSWQDIQQAKLTSELGLAQPAGYSAAERRRIATHESGHATVAHVVAPDRKLEVLSIIKRKDALGLLAHSDAEERWTRSRSEVEALIKVAMGGLVAEELMLGEASTGVAGDLAAATRLAAEMVGAYGMGDSLVSLEAATGPGGANLVAKVLSGDDGRKQVEAILAAARSDVRRVLEGHAHILTALTGALLDEDELLGARLEAVIGAADAAHPVVDLRDGVVPRASLGAEDLHGSEEPGPAED